MTISTSFSDKAAPRTDSTSNTVIAAGSKFVGQIICESSVEINGQFEGEIESEGEVVVSESGVVVANISGKIARVYGRVDGSIAGSELIELKAGACVTGKVHSPRVLMEDGVVFEGACSMSPLADKKASASEQLVANS